MSKVYTGNSFINIKTTGSIFLMMLLFVLQSSAQVFWSENFGTGYNRAQSANGYAGTNGAWTVTFPSFNETYANLWFVSSTTSFTSVGNCGTGYATSNNQTLHISYTDWSAILPGATPDSFPEYFVGTNCL